MSVGGSPDNGPGGLPPIFMGAKKGKVAKGHASKVHNSSVGAPSAHAHMGMSAFNSTTKNFP